MRSLLSLALVLMTGASFVTATQYVVEVYFVVEPQVIKNYQVFGYDQATATTTISSDIEYFVYQVNEMFQSMTQYGLDVKIRAKKVDIMDPSAVMFEDCILIRGTDLQADMAMEVFKEWLKTNNARSNIGYDMAIVWTGYDLFGTTGNNEVAGYATVSATCEENGVSVVEFDGTMTTATTTAHEIAHSLGAPHMTYNPASACSSQYGFIMNPSSSPDNQNRWSFSQCTANSIMEYIATLSPNCLTDTSTSAPSFQMADAANADVLDVEKICQRKKKNTATYFCHYSDFYTEAKGDEVCQKLMCGEKGSTSCGSATPSDGMICDANKRCEKGQCVTSSIPTGDIDTNCVFGDIESEYMNGVSGLTCQDYVDTGLRHCYTSWVGQERCCETCQARKLNIEGCEYGDRNPVCKNYRPEQVCGSSAAVCCEVCHGYTGKRFVRNAVDIPDASKDDKAPSPPVDDTKTNTTGPVTTA